MVVRYMPNSAPLGPPGTPFMIIFLCFLSVLPSPILKSFKCTRSINPGGYLIFFLIKLSVEWRQNHVWGPIFDPGSDHFYKCDHFGNKCIYIYMREGKKGREKGKGKREGEREGKKGREKENVPCILMQNRFYSTINVTSL